MRPDPSAVGDWDLPPPQHHPQPTRRTREPPSDQGTRASLHRSGEDPQLLHHRAHRPRQVDPRRPDAAAHRRRRRPLHARPVPRPHGHRARARHHDQVAGRAHAVGARGRDVRAQHDRHPRPRRLHLRGLPLARRVRGRDPARRRGPGHRGPDPRQPLPGDGQRPRDHPGAQQDRPAGRRPREVRGRDRPPHRRRPRRRAAGERQDGHGRRRPARPRRAHGARPDRRRRRPRPRDDLRLRLRRLPRRRHLRADGRRHAAPARAGRDDVDRLEARGARDRRLEPRAHPLQGARASARSATSSPA